MWRLLYLLFSGAFSFAALWAFWVKKDWLGGQHFLEVSLLAQILYEIEKGKTKK